ncbi:restriction endonuclease [Kitasatospora indigofera]|uniref:restriction endonuclease n=1 Tax=Kitasatospora indigofera TaxID=67307 RepID=UPI003648F9A3
MTTRRRSRFRRPRGPVEHVAAGIAALAGAVLVLRMALAAGRVLLGAWPLLVVAAGCALAVATVIRLRRAAAQRLRRERLASLRLTLAEVDALSDRQFEFALRDLLIRDGWSARQVGQQGDQAADVIGRHSQRGRIVLQAKHTKVGGKVGSQVMYQVKGTAGPAHRADIAVVVTNGTFTRDAKAWGDKHQIHWVDRDRLRAWAEQGVTLSDLLKLPARAPRRAFGGSVA